MADLRDQLERTLSGSYTLDRELSGGGMSRVFVGIDTTLDRQIVVKVLPGETAGSVSAERFGREIKVAARLQHPHIVPLLSAGQTAEGVPFYIMPFVKGESLRERLERTGELSVNEGIRVLRDVAAALAYAHGEGVIHRDIKPANVMLSGGVAVVTDFGVAKAFDAAQSREGTRSGITSMGVALGTPAYMSPEQASADPHVDHRADIYSFGVMAYEVLGGTPPFSNRTPAQLLAAHVKDTPEHLDNKRPGLPASLTKLVMRCLEKRPADRPQTADEIVRELDSIATPSGGTTPTHTPPVSAKRPVWMTAAAIVVLVGGVLAWQMSSRPSVAPESKGKSIAVLPFDNLGSDAKNDFFTEGMTEEITGALAKLPGLHVPARSVSTAAAKKESDVQKIGTALGVEAVLLGTVQRAGERVRIGVQLINVKDGLHLWSEQYDGDMKDVFRVQDSIAKAIVGALRMTFAQGGKGSLVQTATKDPEAHSLYLQGMYLWARRTPSTMPRSIDFLERAVKRDSTYAQAQAGLALAYAVSPDYIDVEIKGASQKALAAAQRALALDPSLAEAYTAIGNVHARLFENAAADSAYRKAIAADSTFATAWHWEGLLLDHVGKMDEAIKALRKARELDPTSLIIATNVGFVTMHARHYKEADSALRKAIELDDSFSNAHRHLGNLLIIEKRYDEGLAEIARGLELQSAWLSANTAHAAWALAAADLKEEAHDKLNEVLRHAKSEPVSKASIAVAYAEFGEMDTAIRYLKEAVAEYDAPLSNNSRDARFDKLRADPRGKALLEQVERM